MTTLQIANLILYNFYFMQICHIFTPKALKLRKTKTCNYIHNDSQELLHHATRGKVIMYMHSAYVYLYVCIYIYTYTYRYKYTRFSLGGPDHPCPTLIGSGRSKKLFLGGGFIYNTKREKMLFFILLEKGVHAP